MPSRRRRPNSSPLRDLFVKKPPVLSPENDRDRPRLGYRENVCRAVARRLHVLAVKPLARGRADYGDAVRDRLLERSELLTRIHYIGRVNGHPLALFPRILDVRRGETKVVYPHVRHRAAAGADIAGVESANENDVYVVERIHRATIPRRSSGPRR